MDEAKFRSTIHSAFEALAGQCRIRCCCGKESGQLSVDQCRLQVLQVLVYLVDLLNVFLRCDDFIGIQKAVVDQIGADHQTVTMTFIWCKFGFGKCFGASWYNHWASCHQLSYKIHPSSYITILSRNGSLLLPTIRDDTEKWWFFFFFWFVVSSWGTHLLSPFTFPICFKYQMTTIEWSTSSSWATSPVVLRVSASVILSISCCQFPMAGHFTPHFKTLICFVKLLEPPLYYMFISSSWAKVLIVWVMAAA